MRGFTAAVVSEHHASDDGYLPSPLVFASAIAARTSRIAISVAALLVPLYEPVPVRNAQPLESSPHEAARRASEEDMQFLYAPTKLAKRI